jgi:hypothetical protein
MSKCKVCDVEIEFGYHVCFDEILRQPWSRDRDKKLRELYIQQAVRTRDAEEKLSRLQNVVDIIDTLKPELADLIRRHAG